jgi:ATP-dependent protease HslVU (ClpYQ) peptidase subunit
MTTLVYSHKEKVIAVDGRCTKGHDIVTDTFNKIITREDGLKFACAGKVADIEALVDSYPYGYEGMKDLEAVAWAMEGGKVFECMISEGSYDVVELSCDSAIGSGSPYALSALDFGKTARQAVKYAMTRDCGTGGKITIIKVK